MTTRNEISLEGETHGDHIKLPWLGFWVPVIEYDSQRGISSTGRGEKKTFYFPTWLVSEAVKFQLVQASDITKQVGFLLHLDLHSDKVVPRGRDRFSPGWHWGGRQRAENGNGRGYLDWEVLAGDGVTV